MLDEAKVEIREASLQMFERRRARKLQEGERLVKDAARRTTRARRRSRKASATRITANAPWARRKSGAERIREDSERRGKDMRGGCTANPMHHLDDSTT